MTKSCNKFKKPCFWSIFGSFSQFWGQKNFFQENPALSRTTPLDFQHQVKFYKKLKMQFQENARTEWRKNRQTLFHRTLPATARGPINKHGIECKLFNIKRRKVLALSIWTHFKYSSCVSIVDLHKGNSGWGTGEYNISLNGAPNIVVMWPGWKLNFKSIF